MHETMSKVCGSFTVSMSSEFPTFHLSLYTVLFQHIRDLGIISGYPLHSTLLPAGNRPARYQTADRRVHLFTRVASLLLTSRTKSSKNLALCAFNKVKKCVAQVFYPVCLLVLLGEISITFRILKSLVFNVWRCV